MALLRLAVGLGNPAPAYTRTRHNVGRDFVDYLAATHKHSFDKNRQADLLRLPDFFGSAPLEPLTAAKLSSYMNQSGPALRGLLAAEGLSLADVLVIVDDFMIPFGTLRLRASGSSGGHNGLNSIIESFGTADFARLRVGVGPVPPGRDPADFVLEPFPDAEWKETPKLFRALEEGVRAFGLQGAERAMNAVNRPHLE